MTNRLDAEPHCAQVAETLMFSRLVPYLSRAFHHAVRGVRTALLGLSLVPACAGALAASETPGKPINDPELAALLRPSAPIVEAHLTGSENGPTYYSAKLKHLAAPGFTKRYLGELESRGVRIRPIGSSPHALRQRVVGYEFMAWQEASLKPYTIRFREGKDREDVVEGSGTRPSYPHPVSVTLDRLIVRLPAEFTKPWKTAVVVPTESRANLPFSIPLPPDAVVLRVSEQKYLELIGSEWRQTSLRQVKVSMQSRMAPREVSGFFTQALQGWGKVVTGNGDTVFCQLGPIPSWAPTGAKDVYVDPTGSTLFQQGTVAVARSANADPFQAKTLPNLPRDVTNYLIVIGFKKEPVN